MKKFLLIAAGLLIATPVHAMDLPTYDPEAAADRQMAALDADHSKTLDGAEFERAAAAHFQAIDSDGDGMLSGDEVYNARYANRPRMLKSSSRGKQIANLMKRWDTNKDSMISMDEKLQNRRAEFRFIDRNEDEIITREELVAHWQRRKVEMESSQKRDSKSKD